MKNENLIKQNLYSKIAIWTTNFNRSEELKHHIIMLDWVVSDFSTIRDIETIVKGYQ